MKSSSQQAIVHAHFRAVSADWTRRYAGRPRKMSDLDLQLRRRTVQRLLMNGLSRGRTAPLELLDVGCGPGDLLDGLPVGAFALHGADLVPEMIAQAAHRFPSGDFVVADAARLPFADGSMDVVTSTGVLEYLPEPERALAEMRRILRENGALIASFPNRQSVLRALTRWEARFAHALRRLRGLPEDDEQPRYNHRHWSLAEVERMLLQAGFSVEMRMVHTYGPYGRLGRCRAALAVSRWLSAHWRRPNALTRRLAVTIVVQARRLPRQAGQT